MSFVWKPAVWDPVGAVLYELPRPVTTLVVLDRWDVQRLEVPLVDGQMLTGHSKGGVVVQLEGRMGTQAGTLKGTEEEMFAELEALREKLDVQSDGEKYELFVYHDAGTATYRKLKGCSTLEFAFDLSDVQWFGYRLVAEADDPVIYTTAPGV